MIKIIGFIIAVFFGNSWASDLAQEIRSELRSGDVLLISLNCYTCALIERSTKGPYSHSGLVLEIEGQWQVAQALGPVHLLALDKFLAQKRKGTKVALVRPRYQFEREVLHSNFLFFAGIPFDSDYLWDDEKLYCSEFIAKFFNALLPGSLGPRPIDYGEDDELWRNILGPRYNGGEPGNSPVSLLNDSFFGIRKFF